MARRGCTVLTEHPTVALWRIGGVPSPLFPQDCLVHCTGEASCSGADVVCAAGTACAVQCLGVGSCHGASIGCDSAKSCDIACILIQVHHVTLATNDGANSNCEKGVCVIECYGGNSCQDVGLVLWCRRDQFSSHAACCEATRLQSYPKTRVPFFFLRASSAASRPGMYSPPIATLRPQYTVGLVPRASAAVLHESRRRTFHTLRSGRWHDNSIITKTDVLKLVFLHEVSSGQAYHAIVKCSPHDALAATRTCSCDT